MTTPSPDPNPTLPTRSEHLGLALPLTTEHFLSLAVKQQNDLIAEQVMGWVPYELESECSQFTPGAQWIPGGEYYALVSAVMVPPDIAETEDDAVLEWLESYGSRDWVSDIGAAIRLFEAIELLRPAFYKSTPSSTLDWEWCCHIYQPLTGVAFCFNGCVEFKDTAQVIALTVLEAIGVINNAPIVNTETVRAAIQARLLQVWARGSDLTLEYSPEHGTWRLTDTSPARSDNPTVVSTYLVRWRQGDYQFEPLKDGSKECE